MLRFVRSNADRPPFPSFVNDSDLTPIPAGLRTRESLRPVAAVRVQRAQGWTLLFAVVTAIVRHGVAEVSATLAWELGLVVVLALIALATGHVLRAKWSASRPEYLAANRIEIGLLAAWLVGALVVPLTIEITGPTPAAPLFRWSEVIVGLLGVLYGIVLVRRVAGGGRHPGFLLAASFVLLISVGTVLLMLPNARAVTPENPDHAGAPFRVAFFTATSASCVTGLIVVPTGSYWSHFGHVVILVLFQIGGLGIMTCGAFFAVVVGSRFTARETSTFGNLIDATGAGSLRALLRVILFATFATEFVGGLLLSTLWPDGTFWERIWRGMFHAVSAFCNAGFSLRDEGFLGWGTRWQIGLVVSGLIIAGGLGFAVMYNLVLWGRTRLAGSAPHSTPLFHFPSERVKLTLATKIVLVSTGVLLALGTVGVYVLEAVGPHDEPFGQRVADAWFQSVTFRTAGFNTTDHGALQPATKLFAILLMFVGASPGSTGGGIKTVTLAIAVLAIAAALRGHERVDVGNRTIPAAQVGRALTIVFLGVTCVVATAMLLFVFETGIDRDPIDVLFEATSAFATVGVSTGITGDLRPASQFVICAAMFLGRVGPLTLLIGLAGHRGDVRYRYPEEAVPLG